MSNVINNDAGSNSKIDPLLLHVLNYFPTWETDEEETVKDIVGIAAELEVGSEGWEFTGYRNMLTLYRFINGKAFYYYGIEGDRT